MPKPINFAKNNGVSELARECNVSITTVSRKLRQGKTPDQIKKEATEWHAKQTDELSEDDETFYAAKTRKEIALADLHELELSVKRGELVPLAEINSWVAGMIVKSRDILLRIGTELCDVLAQTSEPIKCKEIIDAEVLRALQQLGEFRNDQ